MSNLSYMPYFDAVQENRFIGVKSEHLYEVNIHADMLKIKALNPPTPPVASSRGDINSFSRKSRKRMMETMADEIRVPDLFVTLTFSDDFFEDWMNQFKKCFEAFRRRLERAYKGISALWRLELEKRKSGDYAGEYMPHFHLIIWLPEGQNVADLIVGKDENHHWAQWWHDITKSTHPEHLARRGCDISRIKSRRHGYHYVSKYATKTSDENLEVGRRWGRVGQVGQGSRAGVILNRREYIELKRLITSYQKRLIMRKNKNTGKYEANRNKKLAKRTARSNPHVGLMAFGLGVWEAPDHDHKKATIWKMIEHAIELASNRL